MNIGLRHVMSFEGSRATVSLTWMHEAKQNLSSLTSLLDSAQPKHCLTITMDTCCLYTKRLQTLYWRKQSKADLQQTCAFKPGCLMSHNWLHTPDCKVLREMTKQSKPEGMNEGCTLPHMNAQNKSKI